MATSKQKSFYTPGSLAAGLSLVKAVEAQLMPVIGATILDGQMKSAKDLGNNLLSVRRRWDYFFQRQSARPGRNYEPTALDVSSIIRQHHQQKLNGDGGIDNDGWLWTYHRLGLHGIDLATPQSVNPGGFASDWSNLLQMAATAAPLDQYLTQYWRTRQVAGPQADEAKEELTFALRRAGLSRKEDRDKVLNPWAHWSASDATRLYWLGLTNDQNRTSILNADGFVRESDANWAKILHQRYPDPNRLADWSARSVWDDGLAATYGTNIPGRGDQVARFFAAAQGVRSDNTALPNQPDGSTSWYDLEYRALRPLPGFRESLEMQYRLRPANGIGGQSVMPGVQSWTSSDTRNMLQMHGVPDPIADRMMGLQYQPLNLRIINRVLSEILSHPDIAAEAQAAFGENVDWVTNVHLDHGFSPTIAKLAADGQRAHADDIYFAERLESQKRLRSDARTSIEAQYAIGEIDAVTAGPAMIDEFFTADMATQRLAVIDREVLSKTRSKIIASIREAYMRGIISIDQAANQAATVPIVQARWLIYRQEWEWERGEQVRILSTNEILRAVKEGLMDLPTATVRMTNLGWSAPDAVVELAIVERELMAAQAKAAAQLAAHQQSLAASAARTEQSAIKAQRAADEKAAKEVATKAKQLQLAPLKQNFAKDKYYAAALQADADYTAATKTSNADKMAEAEAKFAAAYQEYLVSQASLRQQSPEVQNEIGPIDTARPHDPGQGPGDTNANVAAGAPAPTESAPTGGGGAS
jgi:hypothetical protein